MGRSKSSLEDCNPNSVGQIQHQRVIIENKYKEKLVGILHDTGSKEVVIVCHGYRSCKDRIPMVNLAAAFANEGISAFRFDFAGNGYVFKIHHKRVIIENKYKEKLVGILHETGSKEVVIVCHGYRSCKDRIPMVNLAAAFANEGISAFRFDFAGNGDSEGSFQYGNYYREVDDLRSVMQYFEQEKRPVTAIIGHSKGGNVVLFYASRFKDVDNVVNISGRFDLRRGIEGRLGKDYLQRIKQYGFIDVANRKGNIEYRVTEESLMDRLTTNTSAACQLIPQTCRVLTIHGSGDKIVPTEDAMEFAKHIFNHKLHIIEGADHEYTSHQNELSSVVLNFVQSGSSHDNARSENKSLRSFL